MDYRSFENLCKGKKICIWGFGKIGKTYVLTALKCISADVVCYCDSQYRKGASNEGIPLVEVDYLKEIKNIFVFIALNSLKAQDEISRYLKELGIEHWVFDSLMLTELCNSLEKESGSASLSKYKMLLDDEQYLKILYKQKMGTELDLHNPRTFNEKLQWLKVYDRNPLYSELVDKAAVKERIASIIGNEYVIPTYEVWDKVYEIDFSMLPGQFVLKCTHDTGSVVVCRDKGDFDKEMAMRKLSRALSINYYWVKREWPYKQVKPRILAEKYMGEHLTDYKILCYGGQPEYIFTCTERYSVEGLKVTWFTPDWKRLPFSRHYPVSTKIIKPPSQLDEMLSISRILSKPFRFVRLDFYEIDNRVYFGEYTFYPGSGFEEFSPMMWDEKLGEPLHL